MDKQLLRDILIGIVSGWAVIIFSDSYHEVKAWIINVFQSNKIAVFILEASLPVIFLLVMFLIVVIALRLKGPRFH